MPDPLDQLDRVAQLGRLGAAPPVRPEPVEALRARVDRRRRRRRTVSGTSLVLTAIVAVALTVSGSREDGDLRTTGHPNVAPPSTTGPGTVEPPIGSVLSGRLGVELFVTPMEPVRLRDQPTAVAFALADGLVVAQAAEPGDDRPPLATGPILVLGGERPRELASGSGETFTLHDAGWVRGRPVAVVTARVGTTPDDTDERLLLLDLTTGERSDLGSVGGWEAGVRQARLAGDRIVLLQSIEARSFVMVRSLDGAVEWDRSQDPLVDASSSIAVAAGQVLWLQPSFDGPGFEPTLSVSRYELASGALISSDAVTLQTGSDLQIDQGFCAVPEWSAPGLLCDRSAGGPIRIDLATGATAKIGALEAGVLTVPRPADGADATTPPGGVPCASLEGTELIVGDHVVTYVPPRFEPDGVAQETSTGFVDMGGETHATLRLSDPEGRWIEVDSFGLESPQAHIEALNAGAVIEDVTYQRCIDVVGGRERVESRLSVARHQDRTVLAAQEWEYGGISVIGGPDVTVDELLAVASGLRNAPPEP